MTFYGDIPAGAAGINDLFGALLELQWKSVAMPIAQLHNELRQDLVIHKFVDRDGARVEGVGRSPMQFSGRVPFLNGLTPGANETWTSPLYPTVRDAMLRACADKATGVLQHPELGDFTCKLETFKWVLDSTTRSGVWADVSWIETDESGDQLAAALQVNSPAAGIQSSALDLDSQIADANPDIWPKPYVPPFSFSDLAFAVRGVFDTVTLTTKSVGGRLDNILYEAQAVEDSAAAAGSAFLWPVFQAAELAKSSAYDAKATLLAQGKPVGFYAVPKDSTLAQIASTLGAQVVDIMTLNSALIQSPVVVAGTVVRYYA